MLRLKDLMLIMTGLMITKMRPQSCGVGRVVKGVIQITLENTGVS
jgi:hypothetical protein